MTPIQQLRVVVIGCVLLFFTNLPLFILGAIREYRLLHLGVFFVGLFGVALAIAAIPLLIAFGLLRRARVARYIGLIYGALIFFFAVFNTFNFGRFSAATHRTVGDLEWAVTIARLPLVLAVGGLLLVVLTRPAVKAVFINDQPADRLAVGEAGPTPTEPLSS